MIFPDCSCRFFLHLLERKSSFSKIPNLNIKSAMKSTGPFNQLRSFLPSIVGASGYRFLCIFMAALLFCGMNSQLMAASVVPGANNDFNNNAPASGDKFNSESFLKASNPNADDSQQLTWGEKIGAGILGVALLGGAVAGGYKCYQGRQERIAKQQGPWASRDGTDSFGEGLHDLTGGGGKSENLAVRSTGIAKATETTGEGNGASSEVGGSNVSDDRAPGWGQKASDSLSCLRSGGWSLAQGAYDLVTLKSCLVTLKSCWPAVEAAPEKHLMNHLTEVLTAQLKQELAERLAERPFLKKIYDIVALTPHPLPSHQTERQKSYEAMEAVGKRLATQLTASQKYEQYLPYLQDKAKRAAAIEALTHKSSLAAILATLDPEMQEAIKETLQKYENEEQRQAFAYFIAKNQDEWHPGYLLILNSAFERIGWDENCQAIIGKMRQAVQARWDQDSSAMEQ